jgi:hypothetical protein
MRASPTLPIGLADAPGRHRRLRGLLGDEAFFLAPGAFDCLGARLVEASGCPALYVTGAGVSISAMGFAIPGRWRMRALQSMPAPPPP